MNSVGNNNYAAQGTASPVAPSLLADSSTVFSSLIDLEKRINGLGDRLLGPEPRDASGKDAPEPIPTVRRNLDKSMQMISVIDQALSRIENRV